MRYPRVPKCFDSLYQFAFGQFQTAIAPPSSISRPKTVDDVAHQEEVVRALKKSLDTGNVRRLRSINWRYSRSLTTLHT